MVKRYLLEQHWPGHTHSLFGHFNIKYGSVIVPTHFILFAYASHSECDMVNHLPHKGAY